MRINFSLRKKSNIIFVSVVLFSAHKRKKIKTKIVWFFPNKIRKKVSVFSNKIFKNVWVFPNKIFEKVWVFPKKIFEKVWFFSKKIFKTVSVFSNKCFFSFFNKFNLFRITQWRSYFRPRLRLFEKLSSKLPTFLFLWTGLKMYVKRLNL